MAVKMALQQKSQRRSEEGSEEGGNGSGERDQNGSSGRKSKKGSKMERVDLFSGVPLSEEKRKEADRAPVKLETDVLEF